MKKAGDCEVWADIWVGRRFREEIRIKEDVVGDWRLEFGVQLDHHVHQVTMSAWDYHLYTKVEKCTINSG